MDERIVRMKQVAEKGNIDGFYNLIQEDVKYLEYIDEFPFVDTPLHTAASAGNIPVAMEIMRLKPSFARKPNPNGFSPIDLALQNGHSEMVHQLLHVDQDLVRVRGRGNMTPLHHAAKRNDQLDLLNEFMSICPDSITDVTAQNETVLHIALKNDSIESFKTLVGWLASNWSQNALDYERKILNWKDEKGNTVLHIAISKNQTQAVRHLFAWSSEVDVKIKNKEDKIAWDILQTQTQTSNSEMRKMLIRVGASKGSSITPDSSYAYYLRPPKCRRLEKIRTKYARQMTTISDSKRNALLVVATLLITVTYQAALNPPGGLKPDKDSDDAPYAISSWVSNSQARGPSQVNGATGQAYMISIANLVNTIPFSVFLFANSVTFLISNSVTILLIPDGYIGWMLSGTQAFLWACYIVSFEAITGYPWSWIILVSIVTVLYLILLHAFSVWTRIRRRRHGQGPCGLPNPLQGKKKSQAWRLELRVESSPTLQH
ncbi:ankyrin repeat-containing protein BDA1-like [Quercus lobata]|uniref:PGG domain-containing protein n=1 Tax=Quercus lobata TaxID=97700 RepID=A0A7N2MMK2_QUELO|nr:ankyrin repeat-containing protein BDA1-like [Quercus lobata]